MVHQNSGQKSLARLIQSFDIDLNDINNYFSKCDKHSITKSQHRGKSKTKTTRDKAGDKYYALGGLE